MAGLTTVTSGGISDGTITNADINASASIDASKVSGLSTDSITEGNTTVEVVDTGSNGHITFDTEGSERMRIDSSGNVGIGTISPSEPLHVVGDILSTGYYRTTTNQEGGFFDVAGNNGLTVDQHVLRGYTNGSEKLRIDSSGNVGIGTTSPSGLLHISGQDTTLKIQTGAATLADMTNDTEQKIGFQGGNAEIGLFKDSSGNFKYVIGTYQSTTDIPIEFRTKDRQTRIHIAKEGNVGIGTTSPTEKLHVNGSLNLTASGNPWIKASGHNVMQADATNTYLYGGTNGVSFRNADNSSPLVRIKNDGKVGILNDSPVTELHVNGTIRMSAVPGTNTNASLNVLYQTNDGDIDGGSSLTWNPAGDVLTVNGAVIGQTLFRGSGNSATFTCSNGSGYYDFRAHNDSLRFIANSTAQTEAMRINSSGNVGIGTSTPSCELEVSGTGAVELPQGTTAQRPTATEGMLRYNTEFDEYEFSDGTDWYLVSKGITNDVHFLVIAGGGGGGGYSGGGGGGAGGYQTSWGSGNISGGNSAVLDPIDVTLSTNYTVTVGAGGAGGGGGADGSNGSDSVFATITSTGGGGGNRGTSVGTGLDGGSGGGGGNGASNAYSDGGAGTAGQGTDGGRGRHDSGVQATGGGGGGAGQAGDDAGTGASAQAGDGGDGLASTITGSSVTRGGGGSGGGHASSTTAGTAGTGGGGTGQTQSGTAASAGTANTGGGGGGGGNSSSGGAGGSGVVILRYTSSLTATFSGGVTQTTSTVGTDKVSIITATSSTSETVSFA